jgi:hypothetical protein
MLATSTLRQARLRVKGMFATFEVMRFRPKENPALGFNLRLGKKDLRAFEMMARKLGTDLTANRLLMESAVEMLVISSNPVEILGQGLLFTIRKSKDVQLRLGEIAARDIRRNLRRAETEQVKLTFTPTGRRMLSDRSIQCRWAEGQVILEALQAFCLLASAQKPMVELPDLLRLGWAEKFWRNNGEIASPDVRIASLNGRLGLMPDLRKKREELGAQKEPRESAGTTGLILG